MIYQINEDGDTLGLLSVSSECESLVSELAQVYKIEMWEQEDPYEWFWEQLVKSLTERGIDCERIFVTEIEI